MNSKDDLIDLDSGEVVTPIDESMIQSSPPVNMGVIYNRHARFTPSVETFVQTNEAARPITEIKVKVPNKIYEILNAINDLHESVEFSIFLKSRWCDVFSGFILSEEYVVPKQEVTSAHIDYLDAPGPDWDTVIHKHPNNCMSFSGTDEAYINGNFMISLLWVNRTLHTGLCNIPVPAMNHRRVRFKVDIIKEPTRYTVPVEGIENIIHKTYTPPAHQYRTGYYDWSGKNKVNDNNDKSKKKRSDKRRWRKRR